MFPTKFYRQQSVSHWWSFTVRRRYLRIHVWRQYNRGRGNQRGGGRGGTSGSLPQPSTRAAAARIANRQHNLRPLRSTFNWRQPPQHFPRGINSITINRNSLHHRGPGPRKTCWMRIHFQNKNNVSQAPRAKTKQKTRSQHSPEPTLPSGTDIFPNYHNKHKRPSQK